MYRRDFAVFRNVKRSKNKLKNPNKNTFFKFTRPLIWRDLSMELYAITLIVYTKANSFTMGDWWVIKHQCMFVLMQKGGNKLLETREVCPLLFHKMFKLLG